MGMKREDRKRVQMIRDEIWMLRNLVWKQKIGKYIFEYLSGKNHVKTSLMQNMNDALKTYYLSMSYYLNVLMCPPIKMYFIYLMQS